MFRRMWDPTNAQGEALKELINGGLSMLASLLESGKHKGAISALSSVFDHYLTREEKAEIGRKLFEGGNQKGRRL